MQPNETAAMCLQRYDVMPHGPQRTYREVPFQRAAPPAWEAALNAAPAPKAAPAPLPPVAAAPAPAAGAGGDSKLQFTRPVSQQSPAKPAPINTAYAFGDTKTTSAVHGSELHVSPHGTVRSFRGATAPSATLKTLNGEVLGVPTQMAPVQHSLPTAPPLRSGDVLLVDSEPLTKWDLGPQNRMRPITFKPNGSFATLKQMGKLSGTSFHQSRPSALKLEKESYIPGYTGFIRGKQHIAGRTYGETTRRALSRDYRETVCTSPVPSNPTANRKVFHFREDESFVSNTFAAKTYHVPGYTGFVPGVRQTFSKSYGATTSSELQKHYALHGTHRVPRSDTGFAETHRTRNALPLDSAPLPGGIKTHKPPEKLIPAHLKDIRFLAY